MTQRSSRRPARAALPRRSRRRWVAAAGLAACWLALEYLTGSVIASTVLLALLAGLGAVIVVALRALGFTRDHPWVRRLASRPWRDGQDVLRLALRHLPEVLIVTPNGSRLAPNLVELRMNPADLDSLSERIDPVLVAASAAEVYEERVAACGARFAGYGAADVRILADSSVPQGRYRLRQGQPVAAGPLVGPPADPLVGAVRGAPAESGATGPQPVGAGAVYAGPWPVAASSYPGFAGHDGNTCAQPEPGLLAAASAPTVTELSRGPVPVLRLVTGDSVAETRVSGARAGRGPVELGLPGVPTVSREHARFTFSDGRWWIANLGRNGLTLNGAPLVGEQPLSDGDSIRWGARSDALLSRVEIGRG